MLKVELKGMAEDDPRAHRTEGRLVINGCEIDSRMRKRNGKIYGSVQDEAAFKEICSHTFKYLANQFLHVSFEYRPHWLAHCLVAVSAVFNDVQEHRAPSVTLEFTFDYRAWAHPWSISAFDERLRALINICEISGFSPYTPIAYFNESELGIRLQVAEADSTVNDAIDTLKRVVDEAVQQAVAELTAGATKSTLVTLFEFPGDVATACEQYLLYFVQFLKDLGIEANASIKHEARSVLFSVTPTDGAEALDNVRQALHIYLNLPGNPHVDSASSNYPDIAVQQLRANIFHLKSQVTLSTALAQVQRAQIEAHQSQIEALQLSNYQYKQLLADRGWTGQTDQESGEPILDGLAEIKPVDFHGITVNLPEIFRRLKRKVTGR